VAQIVEHHLASVKHQYWKKKILPRR
jgi:hypothetical protein